VAGEVEGLELMPFTRLLPKRGHEGIRRLARLLSSEFHRAELLTVAEGLRRCATTHLHAEGFDGQLDRLGSMGLVFLPIRRCRRVSGFAHRFYEPRRGESFNVYGVVARTFRDAEEFKRASERGTDHRKLGELLGYPECCVDFFCEVWPEVYDPVWESARRSKGARVEEAEVTLTEVVPAANAALRYFPFRLVPHIPCSFTCGGTGRLAEAFKGFIPHWELAEEVLGEPFTWDSFRGVAVIETPRFVGVVNTYPYLRRHLVRCEG